MKKIKEWKDRFHKFKYRNVDLDSPETIEKIKKIDIEKKAINLEFLISVSAGVFMMLTAIVFSLIGE